MRDELTRLGFEELRTPDLVDQVVKRAGTTMIVVNSVCGCAAGKARPGIALALRAGARPDHLGTVFAGGDIEATARAREYFRPLSAVVALSCHHEGRQAGVHDGTARDRRQPRQRDRRASAGGLQAALRLNVPGEGVIRRSPDR